MTPYDIGLKLSVTFLNFSLENNYDYLYVYDGPDEFFPDLSSGLTIGRQILQIVNKSDGVQNNTPILGNFTSLYIANTISESANTIRNDYIVLANSFSGANSNISNSQMNTIIFKDSS
jgi:hypothetical protein